MYLHLTWWDIVRTSLYFTKSAKPVTNYIGDLSKMSQQPKGYQGDGSTNAKVKVQKSLGNMVKGFAKKATKTIPKFIKETEKDITRISK